MPANPLLGVIAAQQIGPKHPRWKGGKRLENGYVRFTAGPLRGKFEHRVVAAAAWQETHGMGLPEGYEVHHLDFRRDHNCRSNLLILGPGLHRPAHQGGWRRDYRGRYAKDEDEVPF